MGSDASGNFFALSANVQHDLADATLRPVAFFAAAMLTRTFDDVMLPPNTRVLGTRNRDR